MNFGINILKQSIRKKQIYMDTSSFTGNIKADDVYAKIADNVEERFYTSIYEVQRSLAINENKKLIGLMRDK